MSIEDKSDQSPSQEPEPIRIEVGSEDFDIFGAHLQEKGEAFEADLDSRGREALETLFISPYEKDMSGRQSFLATFVHMLQTAESRSPGILDTKIDEVSARITKLQESVNHWEKEVERVSNEPELYVAYKSTLDDVKDTLKTNEALLKAYGILKEEK